MEYKCSVCGEVFSSIDELINHLEGHQKEEDIKTDMMADLNELHKKIDELTDEIDKFNESYPELMKIIYDFTFKRMDEDVSASKIESEPKSEPKKPCANCKRKPEVEELEDFLKSFIKEEKKDEPTEEDFDFLTGLINFINTFGE